MVEEIVYTSAEKGLKQGSRGFCTVVSTAGMSLALAERLESMSGYRHAFPLHDPQASMNPVCFSHVTTRLAGKTLHVISRVADAGQDYTGRSNKLAHHLVIDNVANMPAGPARLMSEPGVIVERWDGNVRNVPPRELRCAPLPASIPLVAWQGLTGDEGWAGSVAEQLLQNPAPVSIIFKPGTDTLTLVREVLDLIPAPQRWNVTFSTYFTRLLAGAECQLRFVLNDTPEATSLRNDARARVIDLTSSFPAATGGTLVAMARKGQLTPQDPAPPQATTAARSRTSVEISTKDTGAEVTIPKLKPGLSPLENPDKPQPPREIPPPVRINSRKGLWIGLTVAVLLLAVTGVLIFQRSDKTQDPFADLVSKAVPENRVETETAESKLARDKAEKDRRDLEEQERIKQLAADKEKKKKEGDEEMAATKLANDREAKRLQDEAKAATTQREKKIEQEGPFAFVKNDPNWHDRHQQLLFRLPPPVTGASSMKIPLRARKETIELSLCEEAFDLLGRAESQLKIRRSASDPAYTWEATVTQLGEPIVVAKYIIESIPTDKQTADGPDHHLIAIWTPDGERESQSSELLRWWPLEISIGDRRAVFLQRAAFAPDTVPTWGDMGTGNKFPFASNAEMKAIPFKDPSVFRFRVSFWSETESVESFEMPLAIVGSNVDDDTDLEGLVGAGAKIFELEPPLKLTSTIPTSPFKDDFLGFGLILVESQVNAAKQISIQSQIRMFLRLPTRADLKNLPSQEQIDFLESIGGKRGIVDRVLLFNPSEKEIQIRTLRQKCDAIINNPLDWHKQRVGTLASLDLFNTSRFAAAKRDAVEAVKTLVDITPKPDAARRAKAEMEQNQIIIDEEKNRERIHRFGDIMDELEHALREEKMALMSRYARIDERLKSLNDDFKKTNLACELTAAISVAGSENAKPILTIHFLETSSKNLR